MSKQILITPTIDEPYIYICHWGELGPDPTYNWHQIWDGVYDDIYWAMGAINYVVQGAPAGGELIMALDLEAQPQVVRQLCPACNWIGAYDYIPWTRAPRWNINHGKTNRTPPAIYWKHPNEYDNNPPGHPYPWQL